MIRRRPDNASNATSSAFAHAAPVTPPKAGANPALARSLGDNSANSAYSPLRRPSSRPTSIYGAPMHGSAFDTSDGRFIGSPSGPSQSYGGFGGDNIDLGGNFDNDVGNVVQARFRRAMQQMRTGMRDATKLDRSWSLVWGDAELRAAVLKLTLMNLLSLVLLSLFPFFFRPLFSRSAANDLAASRIAEAGLWYNILINWPLFAVCFWFNALWGPDIARRAQACLNPAYRTASSASSPNPTPTFSSNPTAWAWLTATRLLLISDFTLISRSLALVPVIGRPVGLAYMCLINSYYAYEWVFASRQWPLEYRCFYVGDRAAFMFGFGLPVTLITSFGPPLVNMAIFALLYPFLLIQALQSRPPTDRHDLLPSTPSPSASAPTTPTKESFGPLFPHIDGKGRIQARIPLFFFARHALDGLRWLADAIGRERGGSHRDRAMGARPGKRPF